MTTNSENKVRKSTYFSLVRVPDREYAHLLGNSVRQEDPAAALEARAGLEDYLEELDGVGSVLDLGAGFDEDNCGFFDFVDDDGRYCGLMLSWPQAMADAYRLQGHTVTQVSEDEWIVRVAGRR